MRSLVPLRFAVAVVLASSLAVGPAGAQPAAEPAPEGTTAVGSASPAEPSIPATAAASSEPSAEPTGAPDAAPSASAEAAPSASAEAAPSASAPPPSPGWTGVSANWLDAASSSTPDPGAPARRRSPGMMGGGIVLSTIGAAGVVGGFVLLLTAAFSAGFASLGGSGSSTPGNLALGGAGGLAGGAVFMAAGIPLIVYGARREVPDPPPAATLWISPVSLGASF
ncbi:MAG: hypothetical protein R3B70_30795 [Polyangiaceae bacterium]